MKDDSDRITSFFKKSKWEPKSIFLLPGEKYIGWRGPEKEDITPGSVYSLREAFVTGVEKGEHFQIELLFPSNHGYRIKFNSREDFDAWYRTLSSFFLPSFLPSFFLLPSLSDELTMNN